MIRQQEEGRADREFVEVGRAVALDEADLLRHLRQLQVGVALDAGERSVLLAEALLGERGKSAVDEDLISLPLVAQDSGEDSTRDVWGAIQSMQCRFGILIPDVSK